MDVLCSGTKIEIMMKNDLRGYEFFYKDRTGVDLPGYQSMSNLMKYLKMICGESERDIFSLS